MRQSAIRLAHDLLGNHALLVALTVWCGVQFWKFLSILLLQRRVDWPQLWAAGGMPSSHSALVTALATSIGLRAGFDSDVFAVAAALAIVVMYDAAGIRQAAGKQAQKINLIVEELLSGHRLSEERLRELLGHTPLQVTVGGIIGVLASWVLMRVSAP